MFLDTLFWLILDPLNILNAWLEYQLNLEIRSSDTTIFSHQQVKFLDFLLLHATVWSFNI